jgi:hypothetical protein
MKDVSGVSKGSDWDSMHTNNEVPTKDSKKSGDKPNNQDKELEADVSNK